MFEAMLCCPPTAREHNYLLPAGVAAGFDKDAEGLEAILGLGFGFMEIGVAEKLMPSRRTKRGQQLISESCSHPSLCHAPLSLCP